MNFYIVWKLWIIQNVITHPTTIEFAFLECHKIHSLWRQLEFWLDIILRDKSRISDSETKLVTAYKNSIIDTENLLTKKNTYKNRQKCMVTNIAEMKYELPVQLRYEQYYKEIEGKTSNT